jgi:hypothetical protein
MIVPQDLYGVIRCPDIVDVPKPIAGQQGRETAHDNGGYRHRETYMNGTRILYDGGAR